MQRILCASNKTTCNQAWDRLQKRVEDRRMLLENARSMNLKRLQQDVERISKREAEFAKKLFEEIVPVRISWNEEAWAKLKDSLPVHVELVTEQKEAGGYVQEVKEVKETKEVSQSDSNGP